MTVSENRQGIVLLPLLARSLARSDGQLISDRVMGITTVLQKMGGQAVEARDKVRPKIFIGEFNDKRNADRQNERGTTCCIYCSENLR